MLWHIMLWLNRFLSTPSGWRATQRRIALCLEVDISIHALRVEGDDGSNVPANYRVEFLSTPSGWRATTIL